MVFPSTRRAGPRPALPAGAIDALAALPAGRGDEMILDFGMINAIVRGMHGLGDDRAATISRLKNLHRMEFPVKGGSGKGVATTFGLDEGLQLALAFELLQFGLYTTRVVRLVRSSWRDVRLALAAHWTPDADAPELVAFSPSALAEFSAKDVAADVPLNELIEVGSAAELTGHPAWPAGRRAMVVNLAAFADAFAEQLAAAAPDEDVPAEIAGWARGATAGTRRERVPPVAAARAASGGVTA